MLYLPGILGLLFGLTSYPECKGSWLECIVMKGESSVIAFLFIWPFVLAFYHGFSFFRDLISRR